MDRLRELAEEPDPVLRFRGADALRAALHDELAECSRIRREALEMLAARGWTQQEMAYELGIGRSRVSQLVKTGVTPAERAFLGTGTVTIALGRKAESTVPPQQHPVYVRLQELARSLKLKTRVEAIPPDGSVTIRKNLIVACGPRRARAVADILRWDPHLGFEQGTEGWHLEDRRNQEIYKSPMDSGRPGDFAFVGRLPCQLDGGGGSFLCLAGIHEVGTMGAVHYMERNLAELHARFGTGHFSMLIRCEFDPDTQEIVHSEEVPDLCRPAAPPL
jgi:predicted XRE-type DNA-binding protein